MEKWSIRQLKFAHEVCFPDNFLELCQKHLPDDKESLYVIHHMDFKHKGGLLPWIFMYSRADYERGMGDLINKILTDLIGDYE